MALSTRSSCSSSNHQAGADPRRLTTCRPQLHPQANRLQAFAQALQLSEAAPLNLHGQIAANVAEIHLLYLHALALDRHGLSHLSEHAEQASLTTATARGQVLIQLRAQIDQLAILGEQFLVERHAGPGIGIGLPLQMPALSQIEAPLQDQPQTEQTEQGSPALPLTRVLLWRELALGQIIAQRLLRQPSIGIGQLQALIQWRQPGLLRRAIANMRMRATRRQRQP